MTLGSQPSFSDPSFILFLYLYLKWVISLCKSLSFTSIVWDLTNCPWCRYALLLFLLCLSRLCRAGRCKLPDSGVVATPLLFLRLYFFGIGISLYGESS